jgi:hypothetical protein
MCVLAATLYADSLRGTCWSLLGHSSEIEVHPALLFGATDSAQYLLCSWLLDSVLIELFPKLVPSLWISLVSKIAIKSKTGFQIEFALIILSFCSIFVLIYVCCARICVCVCVCVHVCVKNKSLAFRWRGMLPSKHAYKSLFIENITIIAT